MESFTNFEKAPDLTKRGYRLDRMALLLGCFKNPEKNYKIIHIAGSKGKGSTAAFAASILKEASFKTGMYSSPHISDYRERISINGEFAEENVYIKNMNQIQEMIEGEQYLSLPGGNDPTTFELLTLLAFLVFRDSKCDWVVLETGLGGRLDATNLVTPEAVIITPIELEHTDLLGSTLSAIAGEKAGIIKKHIPVFSSLQNQEALTVLRNKAKEMDSPFYYLPELFKTIHTKTDLKGLFVSIEWNSGKIQKAQLKMLGTFQSQNCTLAIAALSHVLENISDNEIETGISRTVLPGRMEILNENPIIMIDGAHTRSSCEKLLDSFQSLFPQKGILIFGAVSGKDIKAMADVMADKFQYIIISKPGNFKKNDPHDVYEIFKKKNPETVLIENPAEALDYALKLSKSKIPLLTAGSFYMAAEIRKLFK
jgi:dihydrofolate synthase/folylpolyglutamate synthase